MDQDDKIITDNAFDILYNESKEFELDLLHFDNFKGRNITNYPKIYISFENENIDVQPKLKFKSEVQTYFINSMLMYAFEPQPI